MKTRQVEAKKGEITVHDFDRNIENTTKAIQSELSPRNAEIIKNYDMEMVRSSLAKATRLKHSISRVAAVWIGKAHSKRDGGQFSEALKFYNEAIRLNSKSAMAWCYKGDLLFETDHKQEAAVCYDESIRTQPDYAGAWISKGKLLEDAGNYKEAIKCYSKAAKIKPINPAAWIHKGLLCRELGHYDETIRYMEKSKVLLSKMITQLK